MGWLEEVEKIGLEDHQFRLLAPENSSNCCNFPMAELHYDQKDLMNGAEKQSRLAKGVIWVHNH